MGPHCADEHNFTMEEFPTEAVMKKIQSPMKEIATLGNFNGGDSNRHSIAVNVS